MDATDETSDDSKRCGKQIHVKTEIGLKGIIEAAVKFFWQNRVERRKLHHRHPRGRGCHRRPSRGVTATELGAQAAGTEQGHKPQATEQGHKPQATKQGAQATGDRAGAQATGDRAGAQATGYQGAQATGYRAGAQATGDRAGAQATGNQAGAQVQACLIRGEGPQGSRHRARGTSHRRPSRGHCRIQYRGTSHRRPSRGTTARRPGARHGA